MSDRPEIVCLCGSMRFAADMQMAGRELALAGVIVVGPVADLGEITEEQRAVLHALHLQKIDLADRILVVNPGGYIGESTTAEIAHARSNGTPISYTEVPRRGAPTPES